MPYQTKADKLAIHNSKGHTQSYVYISPTEAYDESGLGQLFIIVEIKSREKKVPTMLNQIVQELSEYYYHSPTKNAEAALETTCQYFNENVLDITSKNAQWVRDKVNILVAAIQNNQLILSNHNNITVWMVRQNKIHDILGNQSQAKTGKKFLSQLISGQLANDDILLFTNSAIFDYFSNEKIKKTIATLAPTQACAFFKNTLLDYKIPVDFSTIIVQFTSFKKAKQPTAVIPAKDILQSDEEIEQLNKAEPKLLAKISMAIQSAFKNLFKQIKKYFNKLKQKKQQKAMIKKQTPLYEKKESEAIQEKTEEEVKKDKKLQFKKWKKFNIVEYRLVIVILVIAVLFVASLSVVNTRKEKQEKNEEFAQTAELIKDKLNSVEAALIYKDENKAQALLAEARSLLDNLSGETQEQQYICQKLKAEIEQEVNRIYKLENIENPELIANLPDNFNPTSNIYISDNNVLYLAQAGEVYKVNSENKSIDKVADISDSIIKIIDFDKSKALLYAGQNKLYLMDTSNSTTRKVTFPTTESKLIDIDSYAQKIYALDEQNNIWKFNYSGGNFQAPTQWLTQELELNQNQHLFVDGNLWLSAADAEITKLFKGKKEAFTLKGAYEPMSSNTLVYTNEDLNNIYLLDYDKNRILIADKQGKVGKQLLGGGFDKILSITPNPNEQEIYILTASNLYKLEL